MLPTVAIVGRPNVGKSTLFNRLVGKKLALVDDQPGVTRDRREGEASLLGLDFTIVDTAGYEDEDANSLPGRMRMQTQAAVDDCDVALFMIDARAGITPLDEEIARWLRANDTPVVLMANKAEGKAADDGVMESFSLGLGEPIPFSAEHGQGLADLFQALLPLLDREEFQADEKEFYEDEESAPLKLAIVGRPNAGKSTLINKFLGENRLLTGPEAGITRDSIAVDWIWTDREGLDRPVRLIDTAGMRKRAKVQEKLEKLAVSDGLNAVNFAEVVVLMIDSTRGLEAQDLRIADKVLEEGRALVVALNKWDTVEHGSALYQGIKQALSDGLAQVRGVPIMTISGATGKGLDDLIQVAFETRTAWSKRVSTGILNRWFETALEANPPPAPGGKRIKLRYITQNKTRPPTFVLFGTRLDDLPESYRRYLVNGIRKELGFGAVPVRLTLRSQKNPYATK
ncbi:ribosome biogenesis GTPase Der [Sphingobium sp. YR768]|jgi:GTP-binding protein|uniref:ribosome biogenesis GTPase Der n=1 Tax=Sphingobium sp. YR768 TaxID=1884365 RepID=UPI0008B068CB|nr:ribosome biogenesis GTPase Der [Sphingobium sp. YR768]SER94130.1 GTP-binding protein [Sphingobium sp. YR768]